MSSVKQIQVTFDCAEPVRVARFWAETLGYRAEYDDEDGSAAAEDPGATRGDRSVAPDGAGKRQAPGRSAPRLRRGGPGARRWRSAVTE